MRVATVDGLVTLFYDGSKKLYNDELDWECFTIAADAGDLESLDISDECKRYWKERQTWQQRVIFADTVIRIEGSAFIHCRSLIFIKLSINLEIINVLAFGHCNLTSVFIPPRCREVGLLAFTRNTNLTIFSVPNDTELSSNVINDAKLLERFPGHGSMNTWMKNINIGPEFALHRVCASFEPTVEMLVDTMEERGGIKAFQVENSIGVTPSQYLKENPYAYVSEKEVIEKYVLQMMGER
ncbi:predicted protein [Chaetoceros tenuissimus]|uniref:Leucine-rich repeat domain-containing protein n=1 Tax=Chaetoceros tenuissimus TaxID=426638 RepID=A0AAD3HBF3_9STRA|nr:predicted protein [Chaetoceros tenuissimus]